MKEIEVLINSQINKSLHTIKPFSKEILKMLIYNSRIIIMKLQRKLIQRIYSKIKFVEKKYTDLLENNKSAKYNTIIY